MTDFRSGSGSQQSDINLVKKHLCEIIKRQKPNGKIPILYLDDEKKFLRNKIEKALEQKAMSFMLSRYLDDELENLTPHTRDSEVLFIIAIDQLVKTLEKQNDCQDLGIFINSATKAARHALEYVKTILKDGLIHGADWRDTREDLDDKAVLTNACYLYKAYKIFNLVNEAEKVKETLKRDYWNRCFMILSSSEWKLMTATLPPMESMSNASLTPISILSSSSLTAIRIAWNDLVAG